MFVKWGSTVCEAFSVNNGVRNLIFSHVYVNDLSTMLESLPCCLSYGRGKINHTMYADGIVLMLPSAGALQFGNSLSIDAIVLTRNIEIYHPQQSLRNQVN